MGMKKWGVKNREKWKTGRSKKTGGNKKKGGMKNKGSEKQREWRREWKRGKWEKGGVKKAGVNEKGMKKQGSEIGGGGRFKRGKLASLLISVYDCFFHVCVLLSLPLTFWAWLHEQEMVLRMDQLWLLHELSCTYLPSKYIVLHLLLVILNHT